MMGIDMVKVEFWQRNIFFSQDQPAYLFVDTEREIVRLKVYRSPNIILIDDTTTGTNRTGTQVIKIWDTNPEPLPQVPTGLGLAVEIYDTNNNLLEKRILRYLYGAPEKRIPILDENGNPLSAYVNILVEPFYYSTNDLVNQVLLPFDPSVASPKQLVEIYRQYPKKYYHLASNKSLANVSSIKLVSRDTYTIAIVYNVDNPALQILFQALRLPVVGQFIQAAVTTIYNNTMWLASEVSKRLGINIPMRRVEFDAQNNKLIVYYDQDIAPLILYIIAIAGGIALIVSLPNIIKLIDDWVITQQVISTNTTLENIVTQRNQMIKAAMDHCGTDNVCLSTLLNALNTPDPNVAIGLSQIQQMRAEIESLKSQRILAGVAGAGAGALLTAILSRVVR